MKKILQVSALFLLLTPAVRAQIQKGFVDISKIPSIQQHYQDEYTCDQPSDTLAWLIHKSGLHAAFGTTDQLYLRCEIPDAESHKLAEIAWRGERVNAQVLVWSPDTVSQVRFSVSNLVSKNGEVINRDNVKLKMVRYVVSNFPYGGNAIDCEGPLDSTWLMPDRFESFERFDLPGRTVRPVWMSVDIPSNAQPGTYGGTLEINSVKNTVKLDINLTVQKQVLPKPHDWTFRLDLWQNPWVIANYYQVIPWSADDFLTERVVFHNPGMKAYPWMSWSNAALPSAADTKFDFPKGTVLSHSSAIDTIDWKSEGPSYEADIKEMTGYFWKTRDANAFGIFTPSFGTGLYHVAEEFISPGMKLWSYGRGADSIWATQSTASQAFYVEMQGGPISDQSVKLELQPNETRWHVEFWIPADKPMDIYSLKVPAVRLRPLKAVPLFGWARPIEVSIWEKLREAYTADSTLPEPPSVLSYCWAPSGMEDLKQAFEWVIEKSDTENSNAWKFYFGTWLAGRGESGHAIKILLESKTDVARALLARLLRLNGDNKGAADAYNSIQARWLQLHPQVVVERDKVLRNLDKTILSQFTLTD